MAPLNHPLVIAGKQTVQLQRAGNSLNARVQRILTQAQNDLVDAINKRDPTGVSKGRQMARVRSLSGEADDILTQAYSDLNVETRKALQQVAMFAANNAEAGIDHLVTSAGLTDVPISLPTPEILRALATQQPIKGQPMFKWWQQQKTSVKIGFRRAMTDGVVRGESLSDIVKRIRGSKGTGGVLQLSRRDATALVRTSFTDISSRAAILSYQNNDDLISRWEFVAVLDERTTAICASLDGTSYSIDDGSAPVPPIHWNCRSTTIPLVDYKGLGVGAPDAIDRQTYPDWFMQQDAETQDHILGPSRAELVRNGDVTFSDLVNRDGSMIPLADLAT